MKPSALLGRFLFCGLTLSALVSHGQNNFTLSDWNKIVALHSPQLSSNGKEALFIAGRRNMEKNQVESELMLINTETKATRVLVRERRGLGIPQWSPSSESISFLASTEQGRQIFFMSAKVGEAQQLTRVNGYIKTYAWSPDASRIAFILATAIKNKNANPFNDSFEVGNHDFLKQQPTSLNTLWVHDLKSGQSTQVLPDSISVSTELSTSSLSWAADSKKLIITVFPSSNSGDSDLGKLHYVNIENHSLQPVTSNKIFEGDGYFSTDSRQVAFVYPRDGVAANQNELHLISENSSPINVSKEVDADIQDFSWLSKGELLFRADQINKSVIWLRSSVGKISKLETGPVTFIQSFSASENGSMLLIGTERSRPNEVYFKSTPTAQPVRLTGFNDELASRKMGKVETISWQSSDGLQPNGIITYPPSFNPLNKYPLALYIHGGPTAANAETFGAQAQTMAAQGWIVFQPNYRGSNNLGNRFQSAIANDPSEGPGHDVMTGVEKLLRETYVDSKRVAVSGWSYGGWMTSWLIGRYPEIWIAAVAGAAPVDYTDMYSLSDLNRMRRHAITDSPYKGDNYLTAIKNSPISNFSKIRTPTLIMSDTDDSRVTVTGSYKLFGALRDNNVPVKFIAYPTGGHFPSDPVRYADVYQRWIEWLKIYLDDKQPVGAR
jgi:dipeptidyl aminopeptidase/acylaminoacyl peptidase